MSDQTQVIEKLQSLMGDTYVLYFKTHAYHWNVKGPNFHSLHLMFEEQYNGLWASLDVLAERLRALGVDAPTSSRQLAEYATISESDNASPTAEVMVQNLIADRKIWLETAAAVLDASDEAGDTATDDIVTPLITEHEKTLWMLQATLGE